jgi:hypothetical protein
VADEDIKPEELKYPKLQVPEFESTIPPHLLKDLSDAERFIVESLSKLEQRGNWLVKVVVDDRDAHIEADKRLIRLERFKAKVLSKWSLVLGVILWLAPILIKFFVESRLKK